MEFFKVSWTKMCVMAREIAVPLDTKVNDA